MNNTKLRQLIKSKGFVHGKNAGGTEMIVFPGESRVRYVTKDIEEWLVSLKDKAAGLKIPFKDVLVGDRVQITPKFEGEEGIDSMGHWNEYGEVVQILPAGKKLVYIIRLDSGAHPLPAVYAEELIVLSRSIKDMAVEDRDALILSMMDKPK